MEFRDGMSLKTCQWFVTYKTKVSLCRANNNLLSSNGICDVARLMTINWLWHAYDWKVITLSLCRAILFSLVYFLNKGNLATPRAYHIEIPTYFLVNFQRKLRRFEPLHTVTVLTFLSLSTEFYNGVGCIQTEGTLK